MEGRKRIYFYPPYNLNQKKFSILFEILRVGEVQQKYMVNRLLLEKSHVSKVVKKLQAMRLAKITHLPKDKLGESCGVYFTTKK
jgi:DNA-binding MarR family transcriptional regulator